MADISDAVAIHAKATRASRAVSSTAMRTPSTSENESGRDRRRAGKLKMRQQIAALRSQNQLLRAVIGQLCPASPTVSAERHVGEGTRSDVAFFDLFGDLDADTHHASTQTDISIIPSQENKFYAIGNDGLPVPITSLAFQEEVKSCVSPCASADAAAGDCSLGFSVVRSEDVIPEPAPDDHIPGEQKPFVLDSHAVSHGHDKHLSASQTHAVCATNMCLEASRFSSGAFQSSGISQDSSSHAVNHDHVEHMCFSHSDTSERNGVPKVSCDFNSHILATPCLGYSCSDVVTPESVVNSTQLDPLDLTKDFSTQIMAMNGISLPALSDTSDTRHFSDFISQDIAKTLLGFSAICSEDVLPEPAPEGPIPGEQKPLESVSHAVNYDLVQQHGKLHTHQTYEEDDADFNLQNLANMSQAATQAASPGKNGHLSVQEKLFDANAAVAGVEPSTSDVAVDTDEYPRWRGAHPPTQLDLRHLRELQHIWQAKQPKSMAKGKGKRKGKRRPHS